LFNFIVTLNNLRLPVIILSIDSALLIVLYGEIILIL